MNDTYATNEKITSENAAELPRWYGVMRTMVFTLLAVSILAMIAIFAFAFKLILSASAAEPIDIETLYDSARIPENAQLISVAPILSGGSLVVFDHDGKIIARAFDANGALTQEVAYE